MKKIISQLKRNFRALILAILAFVMLQVLVYVSAIRDYDLFLMCTVLGLIGFSLELIFSWIIARNKKKNWQMPNLTSRVWREYISNHAILPFGLFLMTAVFVWNNNLPIFNQILVSVVAVMYLPFFVNTNATYKEEMNLRKETNYIFDLFRMVIFFLTANAAIDLFPFSIEGAIAALISVFIASFLLIFLMVWLSKQLSFESILFIFVSSIVLAFAFFLLMFFLAINPITVGLIATFAFYLLLTYWHHKLEGTFNTHIFSEYLLVIILLLIILLGLRL